MPFLNKRLLKDAVTKHRHLIASAAKQDLQALFKDTLNRIETGKFKKEESEKVPFLQQMFELLGYKLHVNLEFEYSTSLGRSVDAVLKSSPAINTRPDHKENISSIIVTPPRQKIAK